MTDKTLLPETERILTKLAAKLTDDEDVERYVHQIALDTTYKDIKESRRHANWVMDQEETNPTESARCRLYWSIRAHIYQQLLNEVSSRLTMRLIG